MQKKVSESMTTQVQIVMQEHINGQHRMFGGKLVEWIDILAAVVARRHSNCNVTTVAIDTIEFKQPIFLNDTVILEGKITCVGKTSMEVTVDVFVETLSGERTPVNRAYLVMVALDENDRPTEVHRLILETDIEKADYEAGIKRYELRRHRKIEQF